MSFYLITFVIVFTVVYFSISKDYKILKFNGKILFDKNFPDGTKIKNLDSSKIRKLKWKPKIKIYSIVQDLYKWMSLNRKILKNYIK